MTVTSPPDAGRSGDVGEDLAQAWLRVRQAVDRWGQRRALRRAAGASEDASPWHEGRRRLGGVALTLAVLAAIAGGSWLWLMRPPVTNTVAVACTPPSMRNLPANVTPPGKIVVNVYNASARFGQAQKVAGELRRRGFNVQRVENDPSNKQVTDVAELRRGAKGAQAVPTLFAQVGAGKQVQDKRTDASIDLVLGARFKSLRTSEQALAALVPQRPSC